MFLQNVKSFSSLSKTFYLIIVFFTRFPQFPANMLWTMALQCLFTVHTWVKHFTITITKREIRIRFCVHRRICFVNESISPIDYYLSFLRNKLEKKESHWRWLYFHFFLNIPCVVGYDIIWNRSEYYSYQNYALFCIFNIKRLSWQFTVHHTLNTTSNLLA